MCDFITNGTRWSAVKLLLFTVYFLLCRKKEGCIMEKIEDHLEIERKERKR